MFKGSVNSETNGSLESSIDKGFNTVTNSTDSLLTIDEVQKTQLYYDEDGLPMKRRKPKKKLKVLMVYQVLRTLYLIDHQNF